LKDYKYFDKSILNENGVDHNYQNEKKVEVKKVEEKKVEVKKVEEKKIEVKKVEEKKEEEKYCKIIQQNKTILKEYFDKIDNNNSGTISTGEWIKANQIIGQYSNSRTAKFIFNKIDSNQDNSKINFFNFRNYL
jgi:hypothetical protein